MRKFVPNCAKTIPPEAVLKFTGIIYEVYQWPQQLFDGSTTTFEMLKRPDTVKIIAVKDNKIIITKQEQPRKDCFYDFPGGRADHDDSDELAAAKRELREETGMIFANWKLIKVEQPFAKIDWLVYTFLATDFESQQAQCLDGGEKIEVLELPFAKAKALTNSPAARYLGDLNSYDNLAALLNAPSLYSY